MTNRPHRRVALADGRLRRRRAEAGLAAVLALASCAGEPVPGASPDLAAPVDLDDQAAIDLSSAPVDLARPGDAGLCTTHSSQKAVPLAAIEAIDPFVLAGGAIRVRLTYVVRGCDVPADILTAVQSGNATDVATLTANVWAEDQDAPSCAQSITVRRAFTIPDPIANRMVSVEDALGGAMPLRIALASPSSTDCKTQVGLGASCAIDCQCTTANESARCLALDGAGHLACAIPCGVDGECTDPNLTECAPSAVPAWSCATPDPMCACDPARCTFGHACGRPNLPACQCALRGFPVFGGPCGCDDDCGPSGLCGGKSGCFIPCTTVGDCPPEGLYCGEGRCQYAI